MNKQANFYTLLRCIAAVLALVLLLSMCRKDPVSNADPDAVMEAVLSQVDREAIQEADNQMIKRLYGLDPADYEAIRLWYPVTNMDAEEVLVVKLTDTDQQAQVTAAIEKRLEQQKTSFDGYGIEQYDLLTNHSVIEVRGNYVLFVVNARAEDARTAFRRAL